MNQMKMLRVLSSLLVLVGVLFLTACSSDEILIREVEVTRIVEVHVPVEELVEVTRIVEVPVYIVVDDESEVPEEEAVTETTADAEESNEGTDVITNLGIKALEGLIQLGDATYEAVENFDYTGVSAHCTVSDSDNPTKWNVQFYDIKDNMALLYIDETTGWILLRGIWKSEGGETAFGSGWVFGPLVAFGAGTDWYEGIEQNEYTYNTAYTASLEGCR